MHRTLVSTALLAVPMLLLACGDDALIRRGEHEETTHTWSPLFDIEEGGLRPRSEAVIQAGAEPAVWLNRLAGTPVMIRVENARLVEASAATRNMAQMGPDIVTTAAIPPGGVATALIQEPGDYDFEIHGAKGTLRGVLHVRPRERNR